MKVLLKFVNIIRFWLKFNKNNRNLKWKPMDIYVFGLYDGEKLFSVWYELRW